jgi:glycosyltransferase involved in cell wall biosynthesis
MHLDISRPASANVWEQQVLPQAIMKNEIDLLHCTSNTAPVGLKVPLIITIQDISCLEKSMIRYGNWYQRFENLYTQWNMPRIAKMADLVITVSDYEREQIIERLKIPAAKVKTIYHACAPHFTPERNAYELIAFREKWKLPERYVLFFGNISPGKNVGNVLKALNLLHENNKLDFMMVMPGITKETLERLLHFHHCTHLQPYIFITGYIPHNELPNLYRLAELFLFPSLSESFGMPILEAMACGTTVITSNRGAIPEVAGKAAFMVDPKNPGEMAEMIATVLNSEPLRKEARARGLKRAATYSWQKTVTEIISVYEKFSS